MTITTVIAFLIGPNGLSIAAAAAASCPDATVVAVPGTTETNPAANPRVPAGLLKKVVEPVKKATRPVRVTGMYVPYPADIIGSTANALGYSFSRRQGVDNATKMIEEQSAKCPDTRYLLTGYSQGAHVAGDLAARIGAQQSPISADKILGVALLADPAQAPQGVPTLGVTGPVVGFAGARQGGFGALTDRVISICAPGDFYCNAPASPTIRLIGLLGSQIDSADPTNSARQVLAIAGGTFLAPVTAAIAGVTTLLTQPNFGANLISGGQRFVAALVQQAGVAGPILQGVGTVINAVQGIITAVTSGAFGQIPGLVATAVKTCADMTARITATTPAIADHASGRNWAAVGNAIGSLQQAGVEHPNAIADRTKNVFDVVSVGLNALMAAVPVQQFPALGPFYAQFTPQQVINELMAFARFLQGGAHTSYDSAPLDEAGHTGVQLMSRWMMNQIGQLSKR
ncbi:cutinase family protein [Mycobacterium hubeiense]|uniref:cutinase family protein n=1 Tax=Mycobacterium hubeiense TaxID=1867256 RepID=UPI0013047A66|nr:cutinase family protein [Mycobacterium sp. QGD 101]